MTGGGEATTGTRPRDTTMTGGESVVRRAHRGTRGMIGTDEEGTTARRGIRGTITARRVEGTGETTGGGCERTTTSTAMWEGRRRSGRGWKDEERWSRKAAFAVDGRCELVPFLRFPFLSSLFLLQSASQRRLIRSLASSGRRARERRGKALTRYVTREEEKVHNTTNDDRETPRGRRITRRVRGKRDDYHPGAAPFPVHPSACGTAYGSTAAAGAGAPF